MWVCHKAALHRAQEILQNIKDEQLTTGRPGCEAVLHHGFSAELQEGLAFFVTFELLCQSLKEIGAPNSKDGPSGVQ